MLLKLGVANIFCEPAMQMMLASPRRTAVKLFYGDNLDVLRRKIKDETVDHCYIDPLLKLPSKMSPKQRRSAIKGRM